MNPSETFARSLPFVRSLGSVMARVRAEAEARRRARRRTALLEGGLLGGAGLAAFLAQRRRAAALTRRFEAERPFEPTPDEVPEPDLG